MIERPFTVTQLSDGDFDNAQACAEGRVIFELFDGQGRLVDRHVGASTHELFQQHERGECAVTCSYCHQTLADTLGEEEAQRVMLQSAQAQYGHLLKK